MARAFHLQVATDGMASLAFDVPDRRVNIFNHPVLEELERLVDELGKRSDIRCLVLLSGKDDTFIAGADLDAIEAVTDPVEAEAASRLGQRIFSSWQRLPFPTLAAIRGTCLGAGTELALASTRRVVSDRTELRIGLPECRLGILPAWGGCTRLPGLIGIAAALDLILAGKTVSGRRAWRLGLADALVPDASFLHHVRELAYELKDGRWRSRSKSTARDLLLEKNPVGRRILFDQARKKTLEKTGGHYPAPLRAIEVIRIGVERGPEAGFDAEARAVGELAVSPVSKNLIRIFRLMEAAKKDAGSAGEGTAELRCVATVGAGAMGGGIAQLVADKVAIPVILKDIQAEALARGMAHAGKQFDRQIHRRRLDRPTARRKMALLHPTLDYTGFGNVDLVIEAVVENLEVKQRVFAEIAKQVPPATVLASNTSSLSVDLITEDVPEPGRVVGMHFFNPVHRMPLVEVVVGKRTDRRAAETVAAFARRLGKTPVLVKSTPGFLVNRLLVFSLVESLWLLDEGCPIEQLDRAMANWGMPMGPFALTDEVGIDVAVEVARVLGQAFGDRLTLPGWLDRLLEDERLGAKNGRGFYRYDGGKRGAPDPSVYQALGLHLRSRRFDPNELVERPLLAMVNEAARCLEEQIVGRPEELDLALVLGTGFPPFRGGLCRWADAQGLAQVISWLEALQHRVGKRFEPSDALRSAAAAGGFYPQSRS